MESVVIIGGAAAENEELFAKCRYSHLFGDEICLRVTATMDHVFFNVMGRTMKKQHAASLVVRGIAVLVQKNHEFPVVFVFRTVVDGVRSVRGDRKCGV